MAFWKVYKYRSKHRYMYDWIWWYRTIGQYPEEQWNTIKEELRKQREKRKEEGQRALNHFMSIAAALRANGLNTPYWGS